VRTTSCKTVSIKTEVGNVMNLVTIFMTLVPKLLELDNATSPNGHVGVFDEQTSNAVLLKHSPVNSQQKAAPLEVTLFMPDCTNSFSSYHHPVTMP
jgi:hypothetical protein